MLLWETFSLGVCPYPGMTNQQAREQVEKGEFQFDSFLGFPCVVQPSDNTVCPVSRLQDVPP